MYPDRYDPLYFKLERINGEWIQKQIKYLTRADVAELLNVSERTVYDYFNRAINPLPHFEGFEPPTKGL